MEITLTPELEKLVNEELLSGDYYSPSDVLREGLLLLKERKLSKQDRIENLRQEVQKGIDAMREGNYTVYNSGEELAEEIIRRGKEKLAEKQKGK